jgi:hypothetical protein
LASYVTLYIVSTQMFRTLVPFGDFMPLDQQSGLLRSATTWVATQILGFAPPISYRDSGSGDRSYDWAFCVLVLIVASMVTALWSALDHKRPNYDNLQKWFRLFLCFALGATLASYGMAKAVPVQMPRT